MGDSTQTLEVSCHRVLNVWAVLWTSIILVSSLSAVSCQSVTITSNISEGGTVCPGQTVTLKCVTRGSVSITWTSDEYVGDPILFATGDSLNSPDTGTADQNTIATLINDTFDGSTLVLGSELRIIVSSVSSTPSVTCVNDGGIEDRFPFRVLGEPGVPQVTIVDYVNETCQLNISLARFNTGDTIQVSVNGLNVDNVTSSDSVPTLTVSYVVTGCDFPDSPNVSARIVDRCGREGQSSPVVTFDPEQSSEPVTSTLPATSPSTDDGMSSSGISAGVVVAIVVPIAVLVIAALVCLVVMIVLCCCLNSKKSTPKRVGDIHLESKNGEEDTKLKES